MTASPVVAVFTPMKSITAPAGDVQVREIVHPRPQAVGASPRVRVEIHRGPQVQSSGPERLELRGRDDRDRVVLNPEELPGPRTKREAASAWEQPFPGRRAWVPFSHYTRCGARFLRAARWQTAQTQSPTHSSTLNFLTFGMTHPPVLSVAPRPVFGRRPVFVLPPLESAVPGRKADSRHTCAKNWKVLGSRRPRNPLKPRGTPNLVLIASTESGDRSAADALFSALYGELHALAQRQLAREGPGVTIGVTTLLHEAYLDLAAREGSVFPDRARFMGYAARVMRGLSSTGAAPEGAEAGRRNTDDDLDEERGPAPRGGRELEEVNAAIEELTALDPSLAELVDLKFFFGFSFMEIAAMRGIAERTCDGAGRRRGSPPQCARGIGLRERSRERRALAPSRAPPRSRSSIFQAPDTPRLAGPAACEGDPDLVAGLEALLALHDEDRARRASSKKVRRDPLSGVSGRPALGAYTLAEPIGAGGMGTVWLARRSDGRSRARSR